MRQVYDTTDSATLLQPTVTDTNDPIGNSVSNQNSVNGGSTLPQSKPLSSPTSGANNNNNNLNSKVTSASRNSRSRSSQSLVVNNNEYNGKRIGTPAGYYANGDSLSRLSPEGKDAELTMGDDVKGDGSIPAEVFSTSSNENGKINVQVTVLFGK